MRKFWKETVAQDLVEYALIIAVIALGCIPVVSGVRYALATLYGRQADTIHQNLATPQQPATATKGVPIVGPSPADAAPDTSSGLNKGLMATVYWAIQRFVRFVGLIVIITIGLLYASSRGDALRAPLRVFRPLKTVGGGPFFSRSEPKFTFSSVISFIGYIALAAAPMWIALR